MLRSGNGAVWARKELARRTRKRQALNQERVTRIARFARAIRNQ